MLEQLHFSFSDMVDQRIALIGCPLDKSSVAIHAVMDVSCPTASAAQRASCHGGVRAHQASRPRSVRRKIWLTRDFRFRTIRRWRKVKPRWSAVRHTTLQEVTENSGTKESA